MNSDHKEVLRSNHRLLCKSLDLKYSDVLDKLYEENTISTDEAEEINKFRTKREQSRRLMYILKRKDQSFKPFESFMQAIKADYDFLFAKLSKDAEKVLSSKQDTVKNQDNEKCVHCKLLVTLNPSDVSDYLYEIGGISDEDLEQLNDDRVVKLFEEIRTLSNDVTDLLISYLHKNYRNIFCKLEVVNVHILTVCHCDQTMEVETKVNKSIHEEKSLTQLPKPVQKCHPNDRVLLKTCNKVRKYLYLLKEEGKWDDLDRLSENMFVEYSQNPDIQIMLFRNEIDKWCFFKEDYHTADITFNKALELLPKTNMRVWHLCRLFAVKIAMCARKRLFVEAQELIMQAHQEMSSLYPCLATATLYFYEGQYLSYFLRCCRHGSKSESIFERAKECFLLAIEHFRKESFFSVKLFLSKAYILLAAVELNVDTEKFANIETSMKSGKNMHMVKYYLDLFENEFWDISTRWSRFLFFIVRAEQHNQMNNISRSIDYLKNARACAVEGKFDSKISYIDQKLSVLSRNRSQQRVFEMVQGSTLCISKSSGYSSDYDE